MNTFIIDKLNLPKVHVTFIITYLSLILLFSLITKSFPFSVLTAKFYSYLFGYHLANTVIALFITVIFSKKGQKISAKVFAILLVLLMFMSFPSFLKNVGSRGYWLLSYVNDKLKCHPL